MQNISEHISYQEAVISNTAKAKGINNTPSAEALLAMQTTANKIFEPVRNHFGKSIRVSSFFRSAALNVAIGGSKSSQHVKGQALDMDNDGTSGPSNKQIFEYIRDNVKFDQLIVEGINDGVMAWVHCSYSTLKNRGEILFMYTANGEKVYEAYSPARYKALIK